MTVSIFKMKISYELLYWAQQGHKSHTLHIPSKMFGFFCLFEVGGIESRDKASALPLELPLGLFVLSLFLRYQGCSQSWDPLASVSGYLGLYMCTSTLILEAVLETCSVSWSTSWRHHIFTFKSSYLGFYVSRNWPRQCPLIKERHTPNSYFFMNE
jgi:hypothetical protein